MDRNHFQTLMHRALQGMIDGLTPGRPGRPAKPQKEAELEAQVQTLQKRLAQLEQQSQMTERLLGLAGELLGGKTRATKREPSAKKKRKADKTPDDLPAPMVAPMVAKMCEMGIPRQAIARVVGLSTSTIRRRLTRNCEHRPSRRAVPSSVVLARVDARVRATRGQIGATALAKAEHISRRQAALLKRDVCTTIERERLGRCARVHVLVPGVMRGFDQLYIKTDRGRAFLLPMADAAVPFRTSCALTLRYDEDAVLAALERDFDLHGAPLVLRLDLASQHRTERVSAMLARRGVLALHGPAHHPRFYGQLERQNREHRAYFGRAERVPMCDVERRRDAMISALNGLWPRRALAWKTPQDVWTTRPHVRENREVLRQEVEGCRRRWQQNGVSEGVATRLAVVAALTQRGYLRVEGGSAC
jgi:transposase InsO family protein